MNHCVHSRQTDNRTRRDRVDIRSKHWDWQIDALVVAYLEWRASENAKCNSEAEMLPAATGHKVVVEELDIFCECHRIFPSFVLIFLSNRSDYKYILHANH